jgi:hypothetical protein
MAKHGACVLADVLQELEDEVAKQRKLAALGHGLGADYASVQTLANLYGLAVSMVCPHTRTYPLDRRLLESLLEQLPTAMQQKLGPRLIAEVEGRRAPRKPVASAKILQWRPRKTA